jgi:hypothetical protein
VTVEEYVAGWAGEDGTKIGGHVWVPEIRSSAPVISDIVADPVLLATVDDRSPHRRVTGTRGVPCLLRHDLVFARARVTQRSDSRHAGA